MPVECEGIERILSGPITAFCVHGGETLGSLKGEEFLDHLKNYQLLKKNFGFSQSLNSSDGNV
jgi:hypothetical protein